MIDIPISPAAQTVPPLPLDAVIACLVSAVTGNIGVSSTMKHVKCILFCECVAPCNNNKKAMVSWACIVEDLQEGPHNYNLAHLPHVLVCL